MHVTVRQKMAQLVPPEAFEAGIACQFVGAAGQNGSRGLDFVFLKMHNARNVRANFAFLANCT